MKAEKWTLKDVEFHNTIKLFKSVIIDESHKVKSTATQQTKFCKGIASGKEYIILLTGTPVVNKPKDLVAQLGYYGSHDRYGMDGKVSSFGTVPVLNPSEQSKGAKL